tara:strand:+ start:108 stop:515 length:408 start_codon:yes stop_codon:yes gene_type:complete
MTDKIAKEVAEQEFTRFAESMDLDINPAGMDAEDKKGFDQQKDRIISAIQSGSLVINDSGEPVFTPQRTKDADAITFHEPTGASLMAMDRKKKTEDIGKLYASMGEITRTHASTFSKMKMPDLKVCMAITTLFLG